jgi:hypothetical protein
MQMLEEGTTRSVLEDHNSCERLVACAVTKQVQHVLVVHSGQDRYLKQERLMFSKVRHTTLQQTIALAELTEVETTAISTPLDRVPLYSVQPDEELLTLMKSSQAACSSALPREGTPEHTQYVQHHISNCHAAKLIYMQAA